VVVKNPADFVGSVLGESEKNTKAILKTTEGKVLIIDEAYMLSPGPKGGQNSGDPYKTAVIDTMVAEIQSCPGEDRCVLLLGYREQMAEMLRNANPGMARRFPLDSAFQFDDFSDSELRQILDLKLKKQGLEATDEAKDVAISLLSRARDRPNFGNAGAVENLLSSGKDNWQKRVSSSSLETSVADVVLGPRDFDEYFDRDKSSATNVKELFSSIVGCNALIEKLQRYQRIAVSMKARKIDPREFIPFNFIFKGPPGKISLISLIIYITELVQGRARQQ
jgi:AAA lid domain